MPAAPISSHRPDIPAPRQDITPPSIPIPPGACDCHAHVFGPIERFPYSATRKYTPHQATVQDYERVLRKLRFGRGVLIQPTVYGANNSALLHALQSATIPLRGVIVIHTAAPPGNLSRLHDLGVRGFRLNVKDGASVDEAQSLARLASDLGWHLDMRVRGDHLIEAEAVLRNLPCPVAIAHMGQVPPALGIDAGPFAALRRLLDHGNCWVKLSAPMRMSVKDFPYEDVLPFIEALTADHLDRLVWATDWPHTRIDATMPDDGLLCDLLARWVPAEADRERILVENPETLYGF